MEERNLCVKPRRQAIKDHFKLKCKNGTMNSKQFWKMIKPFISNKGNIDHNDIILVEEGNRGGFELSPLMPGTQSEIDILST